MAEPVKVVGLKEFTRDLGKVDRELPKAVRLALNDAAAVVVDYARPKVPRRSGAAAASVRAASTRTAVRVKGGGRRAPYYPWLDFGGRVGKNRSVERPFYKDGRYIYDGYFKHKDEMVDVMQRRLREVADEAGLAVQ